MPQKTQEQLELLAIEIADIYKLRRELGKKIESYKKEGKDTAALEEQIAKCEERLELLKSLSDLFEESSKNLPVPVSDTEQEAELNPVSVPKYNYGFIQIFALIALGVGFCAILFLYYVMEKEWLVFLLAFYITVFTALAIGATAIKIRSKYLHVDIENKKENENKEKSKNQKQ